MWDGLRWNYLCAGFSLVGLVYFIFVGLSGPRLRGDDSMHTHVLCVFFFQAEDGIRDLTVTGVQTCALPISMTRAPGIAAGRAAGARVIALRTTHPDADFTGAEAIIRDFTGVRVLRDHSGYVDRKSVV